MPLFRMVESVTLDGLVLVAAFDGWVDAGNAGTLAARQLLGDASRVVASFDADALFDYRARRPGGTRTARSGPRHRIGWRVTAGWGVTGARRPAASAIGCAVGAGARRVAERGSVRGFLRPGSALPLRGVPAGGHRAAGPCRP